MTRTVPSDHPCPGGGHRTMAVDELDTRILRLLLEQPGTGVRDR
ncbi:hypothetical protein [Streptomyces sp. NBC_00842]